MAFSRQQLEFKTVPQMQLMHQAGLILSRALDAAVEAAVPGVTTADVDAVFAQVLQEAGATPNFLGYYGYPATICASVNEEVVHGIPGDRVLQVGDVLKIDGGCIVEGWHSDSARTVILGSSAEGTADPEDESLSEITRQALWHGIAAFATAKHVGEIGDAIDDFVSSQPGAPLGILQDYVGHGIGSAMHLPPDVLNYRTGHRGPKVRSGLCLAIEPMLVRGGLATEVLDDEWTVVTRDGARASQWEHSVARHDGGIWVLTAPDGGAAELAPLGIVPVPLGS
ncbi:type I methionyl aminopeptidase [Micrococcus terreus]|uniref:type I methionyl aminopeptidase n=1 Tax=Micrococcus terreus TaxID=574650 RepID=UPI00254DE6D7|nr:type I methionyl aminopeptidase [Micrococcus terreus]MDK7702177.1 type I methionyl aminopeptidase [Micrococcus terreus]WOO96383.1 type I methionyl aminopeptidase [Micrococcus terreus]